MMDRGTDHEVLRAAVTWLHEGSSVVLVTVARTWGSAPRRPGALMAIGPDGRFVGSVSGGCVEDDLVERVLRGEFDNAPPRLLEYGVPGAASRRVGLPCGGQLGLVVEYLDAVPPLQAALDAITGRQRVVRRVCLATGETSLHPATGADAVAFDGETLNKVFGPAWRLLIIGAGELARRVAQLALTLDYAVTVCDPRPEYAEDWAVDACELVTTQPAQYLARFAADEYSVVLALAHAPPLEDEALAAALHSDAFYIGALGSTKNQRARVRRLQRMGVSEAQCARLHGPVGLPIGSRTPAEIAVAIAAALIEARHQRFAARRPAAAVHA